MTLRPMANDTAVGNVLGPALRHVAVTVHLLVYVHQPRKAPLSQAPDHRPCGTSIGPAAACSAAPSPRMATCPACRDVFLGRAHRGPLLVRVLPRTVAPSRCWWKSRPRPTAPRSASRRAPAGAPFAHFPGPARPCLEAGPPSRAGPHHCPSRGTSSSGGAAIGATVGRARVG
jgi:hypothetical protein